MHIDEKRPIGRRDDLSSQAVDACEIEANQFAAELLMPESLVREFVRNLGSNHPETSVEDAIEELARAFRVSQLAMTYRLTNLRIVRSDDEVAG